MIALPSLAAGIQNASGWYKLSNLRNPTPGMPAALPESKVDSLASAVLTAGFLVIEPACAQPMPANIGEMFHNLYPHDLLKFYVRRLGK